MPSDFGYSRLYVKKYSFLAVRLLAFSAYSPKC